MKKFASPNGNRSRDIFHPLCLNPRSHWSRLQCIHSRVDRTFADRVRSIELCSPLMSPFCRAEQILYGSKIRNYSLERAPVFIIGHWRSGTTLLHNLLSRDPQFGYVTLFQTLAPRAFLVGRGLLQPLLALRAPHTRPMDNVPIRMHYPSEEEFALAHLCPQSPYLGWYFPHDWPELFTKYALMQRISFEEKREWMESYHDLVVKATIHFNGRRLVLKNPINTGRVCALLDLFPNAKFIHVHRNPYDVFRATVHLFQEVVKSVALQEIDKSRLEDYVLDFYPRMMNAYWEQREEIPPGQHVEVRYEDLLAQPLAELERVYDHLGLSDWTGAMPPIVRFLAVQREHRQNHYAGGNHTALVNERWGFALDRLGYERSIVAHERCDRVI